LLYFFSEGNGESRREEGGKSFLLRNFGGSQTFALSIVGRRGAKT